MVSLSEPSSPGAGLALRKSEPHLGFSTIHPEMLNPHPRCHPGGYAAEKQIPISNEGDAVKLNLRIRMLTDSHVDGYFSEYREYCVNRIP